VAAYERRWKGEGSEGARQVVAKATGSDSSDQGALR